MTYHCVFAIYNLRLLKVLLFTIMTTAFSLISLSGQTLRYDVIKGNKNLGALTVKRILTSTSEEIKFESDVTFRILFAFNLRFSQYEKFSNGQLNWGKAISTLSGRTQKDSRIILDKRGYPFHFPVWAESYFGR